MSEYKLTEEIIKLSQSKNWDAAKLEWVLTEVYESEEPDTCLCEHYPIIEICVLSNKINRNSTIVGNCCVKKFIGLPSNKIFQAIKRVRKDNKKSLNAETIEHAFNRRWINEWEKTFYFNVMRKRKLSEKQARIKNQINEKVMLGMRRR